MHHSADFGSAADARTGAPAPAQVLGDGSLWLGATVPGLTAGLTGLIGTGIQWSRPGGVFGLWIDPRGALVLRHRTSDGAAAWQGPADFCGAGDRLRISVQIWTGLGRLLVQAENAVTGAVCSGRCEAVGPLPLIGGWTDLDPELVDLRLASVPLGARGINGVAADTPLPTPDGWCPAGTLRPGDRLQTPDGPVLLRGVRHEPMTDRQRQDAMVINPPWFGLTQPVVLDGEQRLRLATVEVEALTGQPELLVALRDIAVGRAVHPDWTGTGEMIFLDVDETRVLPLGGIDVMLQGTAELTERGAVLPSPGEVPWARAAEARAVIDAVARRKGVLGTPHRAFGA